MLAQYDNGEWYAAKVRATSRAADGAQLYVVAFDEDGLVQHLPAQRLRAPRTATPQGAGASCGEPPLLLGRGPRTLRLSCEPLDTAY